MVYYAYKINSIISFSLATNTITKTASSIQKAACITDNAYYPVVGAVALSVCVGSGANSYNNVTCQLTYDGHIAFVGTGTLNNQSFIVSGTYSH